MSKDQVLQIMSAELEDYAEKHCFKAEEEAAEAKKRETRRQDV